MGRIADGIREKRLAEQNQIETFAETYMVEDAGRGINSYKKQSFERQSIDFDVDFDRSNVLMNFKPPQEVKANINPNRLIKKRPGFAVNPQKNYQDVINDSDGFWESVWKGIAGEDGKLEIQPYLERGFGKSNLNLMLQYHQPFGFDGVDYKQAFGYEPEGTGIIERLIETGAGLFADSAFFLPAMALSAPLGLAGSAGVGAFVNETIKTMYLEALERGDVDTFSEWFDIFYSRALWQGTKAGINMFATVSAPGLVLPKLSAFASKTINPTIGKAVAPNFFTNTATQVLTMNAVGLALDGHMPTKESLINDFLLFGAFNYKGGGMKLARKLTIGEAGKIEGRTNLQKIFREKVLPKLALREGVVSVNGFATPGKRAKTPVSYGPPPENVSVLTKVSRHLKDTDLSATKSVFNISSPAVLVQGRTKAPGKVFTRATETKIQQTGKSLLEKHLPKNAFKDRSFMDEIVDRLYPVKEIVKRIEKHTGKKGEFESLNFYELQRMLSGAFGTGMTFITRGSLDFKTMNVRKGFKGLEQILDDLQFKKVSREKDVALGSVIKREVLGIKERRVRLDPKVVEKNFKELNEYLIAKRILEKYDIAVRAGNAKNYNIKTIEKSRRDVSRLKKYEPYSKEIQKYNKALLEYVQQSGVFSKKTMNMIIEANKDYVPFYKVVENPAQFRTAASVKELKKWRDDKFPTSFKDIDLPTNSLYKNTLHLVMMAERNMALSKMFDIALKNPELMPEVKFVGKNGKVTMSKGDLEALHFGEYIGTGGKVKGKKVEVEAGLEAFQPEGFFRGSKIEIPKTAENISYFKNGEKYTFKVEPRLYRALAQTSTASSNVFFRMSKGFSESLRFGATLTPEFFVKNLFRDALMVAAVSKNYHIPFVATVKGAAAMFDDYIRQQKGLSGNEYMTQYIATGGGTSAFLRMNKNYLDPKLITEFNSGRNYRNQVPESKWESTLDVLRTIGSVGENMARVGEFRITLDKLRKYSRQEPSFFDRKAGYRRNQTMTPREQAQRAGFEARDLIDFAKGGHSTMAINQMSAFFNARLRGYEKLYTALRDRTGKTLGTLAMFITLPTFALWMVNNDDPAYDALTEYEKDSFFNVPLHKFGAFGTDEPTFLRFPVPWEAGHLMGTSMNKILDSIKEKDPDIITDYLLDYALHQGQMNLVTMPTMLAPILEASANHSFFTGFSIVPESKKNLLPEYQITEETSELAKYVVDVLPFDFSPMYIDNFVRGWTGGLGTNVNKIINATVKGLDPDRDVFDIWSDGWMSNVNDIPILKAFFVRSPNNQSSHVSNFYDEFKKTKQAYMTREELLESGEFAEAEKLRKDMQYLIYEQVKGEAQTISDLRKLIEQISTSKTKVLNDNDKRDAIDRLYLTINEIAKRANQKIKDQKKLIKQLKSKGLN